MSARDRRGGFRVPLEVFLDQYIADRRYRGLTTNISESGLFLRAARSPLSRPEAARGDRVVSLEIELPDTHETIWARGEICHEVTDALAVNRGIRFTAMARAHARLLRDYCVETRRQHLGSLLARVAGGPASPAIG